MSSILKEFRDAFDWADANSTGRIIPLEGGDAEYDSACKKIEEIESNLNKHIKEQKTLFGKPLVRTLYISLKWNFLAVSYVLN